MNKKICLLILLIGFFFTSCKKSDIEYQNSFEKSQQAWLNFKKANNNSYQYTVTGGTWIGRSWETRLSITNGKITQRHFKYTNLDEEFESNIPEDQLEWTENEDELNSHEQTPAAASLTLDEVYETAKNVWLKKQENATTYFKADNDGLISSCGFVENNCMDDCFVGITIAKIEPLNQ
ncbi:hypothetical protein [Albibacterium bauzanense]|uniref:Lipoprotein n=1 Tax=Albibacterium bauzanense TaxID=653929 RepID=A0A4R1LWH7_9SPHI|nr:hypothetical protein [Albibacterium bauzanense]TCK83147.1 hypothetical protein C8N28_1737 [Albibacterium bauzanense]